MRVGQKVLKRSAQREGLEKLTSRAHTQNSAARNRIFPNSIALYSAHQQQLLTVSMSLKMPGNVVK